MVDFIFGENSGLFLFFQAIELIATLVELLLFIGQILVGGESISNQIEVKKQQQRSESQKEGGEGRVYNVPNKIFMQIDELAGKH